MKMKNCVKCNKLVWLGQQSKICFNPMHLKCHQEIISNLSTHPNLIEILRVEIDDFESKTGIKTDLKINKEATNLN